MAQLLMQGTGLVNFIGRYAYVGEGSHGFEAVAVTERDEPQAVIGSRAARAGVSRRSSRPTRREATGCTEAYHHGGDVRLAAAARRVPLRGPGQGRPRIYDVAQIDNKGFSERIVSAPVSPLGQKLYVEHEGRDVGRAAVHDDRRPLAHSVAADNQEQPVHPLYDYAFVTDREEGLVSSARCTRCSTATRATTSSGASAARFNAGRRAHGRDVHDARRHDRLRDDAARDSWSST